MIKTRGERRFKPGWSSKHIMRYYFTFAILFTAISIVFASPVYTIRNALAISVRFFCY